MFQKATSESEIDSDNEERKKKPKRIGFSHHLSSGISVPEFQTLVALIPFLFF